MKSIIKVIGIDPGLADTGFGVVEGTGLRIERYSFGTIRTSPKKEIPLRLNHIFSQLCLIFNAEKPDLNVVEGVFSLNRHPKSGIALGKVCGVVLVAGAQHGIPTEEISAREVKRILTGNGNASKVQVEMGVRHFLKERKTITPSHASDALGLAIAGLFRYGSITAGPKRLGLLSSPKRK